MNDNNMTIFRINEKIEGALCYVFGIVSGLFFLILEKNKFVKFHAYQSIYISLTLLILLSIFAINSMMIFMYGDTMIVIIIFTIILSIFLMYKSLKGEKYKIF